MALATALAPEVYPAGAPWGPVLSAQPSRGTWGHTAVCGLPSPYQLPKVLESVYVSLSRGLGSAWLAQCLTGLGTVLHWGQGQGRLGAAGLWVHAPTPLCV